MLVIGTKITRRRVAAVLSLAALVALGIVGAAVAGTYHAQGGSTAGFSIAGIVSLGSSTGSADTQNSGTSANSSASAVSVLGMGLGPSESCAVSRTSSQNGEGKDTHASSFQTISDPAVGSLSLLNASCDARANKNNSAKATSDSSVADASVNEVGGATLLSSHTFTQTTSGQGAHTNASYTVASASAAGHSATVLSCSSSAFDTQGDTGSTSSVTVVNIDGEALDVPDVPCPLATSAASYESD